MNGIVVDADDLHRAKAESCVREFGLCERAYSCAQDALQGGVWQEQDLLLVDCGLPNQGARVVVEAAFRLPCPPVVVLMGSGQDCQASVFSLAKAGVHAYVPKPLDATALRSCFSGREAELAPLREALRPYVGRIDMLEVVSYVRETFVCEALERSGGSRRSAARREVRPDGRGRAPA